MPRRIWGRLVQPFKAGEIARMDVAIEVCHSPSGAWHGLYDVEHIDFPTPSHSGDDDRGDEAAHGSSVVHFHFVQDKLQESEGGLKKYAVDNMDEMSGENLVQAYNDAMALDIKPESVDVEFVMQGLGS